MCFVEIQEDWLLTPKQGISMVSTLANSRFMHREP